MLAVISRWFLFFAVVAFSTISAAEKKYGPGVSDTEIKIGQTMAYSGPASALGTLGKAEMAYFKKVNDEGGVNGRRIKFISLDDGYSPPKTVEQTRKLVELEEVLLLFSSLGTAHNSSVHRYLNAKQVPQLFIASSGLKWNSPGEFRWTMAATPSPRVDMPLYAKYLLRSKPAAKIGVLYQNDDFGKDNLKALKEALGDKAPTMILSETTYEATDPTVDSQIVTLKGANVDVVFILASPKAAAQAIRKIHDMDWKPLRFLPAPLASVQSVFKPAGLEKSAGVISAAAFKDPTDPALRGDAALKNYLDWMKKYYPEGDAADLFNVGGYSFAQLLVDVLKMCGDELTRENVMKQAASLKDVELPMLLTDIKINTSSTDYAPIEQMRLQQFDGKQWVRLGDPSDN